MTAEQRAAAVVLPGLLVTACRRGDGGGSTGGRADSPPQALKHFPTLEDKETHDRALSDRAVRASKALQDGDAAAAEAIYRDMVAKYPKGPSSYTSLESALF